MLETEFSTKIRPFLEKWFSEFPHTCAIEYKVARGGTFCFRQWWEKQGQQTIELNNSTTNKGTYYKIPDTSQDTKPYDAFFICNARAYLIIYFDKWEEFFIIPIQDVNKMGKSVSYKHLKENYQAHILIKRESREHSPF